MNNRAELKKKTIKCIDENRGNYLNIILDKDKDTNSITHKTKNNKFYFIKSKNLNPLKISVKKIKFKKRKEKKQTTDRSKYV